MVFADSRGQSLVLKTENKLIVISYKSDSEFDLENTISWNGKMQQKNENLIVTGGAVSLISSQVGYLFGVFEVNYNQQTNYYSDLLDKREFVRIYNLLNKKNDYERNGGQLYVILKSLNKLTQPLANSVWELTLRKPSTFEINEMDAKMEQYVLKKDSINNENEKYIYEREQKGYEYYYKYKNTVNELEVRKIVDSVSTAVALHGYFRRSINLDGVVTDKPDLDFWYNPTYTNYFNLLNALEELGQDVAEFKKEQAPNPKKSFFRYDFEKFNLDLLPELKAQLKFRDSFLRKEVVSLSEIDIPFISYDDLILDKEANGRPKDITDVEHLKSKRKED